MNSLFLMPCRIILQPLLVFRSMNCLMNYYLIEANSVKDAISLGCLGQKPYNIDISAELIKRKTKIWIHCEYRSN